MARKEYFKTALTDVGDHLLPTVALVGRPNVGKSTLFNRLTRSRRAIVDPTPGMTRDRLYGTVKRGEYGFRLVDTGGLETSSNRIADMIRNQTNKAVAEASILLFMVDGREPFNAADEEIASALRILGKPVLLLVNKLDGGETQVFDTAVYGLGFEQVLRVSAEHGIGIEDLLEKLDDHLSEQWSMLTPSDEAPPLRLAIIGRPNVGKSSTVNKLLRQERVMVSDIPGTTRDPIDSYLTYQDRTFCLVDTAGIRKRGRIEGSQESLSVMMARRQVEDADVVALLVDATEPDAAQDAAIAGIANKAYRPIIVVVNKWDLIENKETDTTKRFEERIRRRLKFLETTPFVFVSAETGQRMTRILDLAVDLFERSSQRVTTGVVNRFVNDLARNTRMPSIKGKPLKIYYITQVDIQPPTFMLSVNVKGDLHYSQERFVVNRIREAFDLDGIPIRLRVRTHGDRDA